MPTRKTMNRDMCKPDEMDCGTRYNGEEQGKVATVWATFPLKFFFHLFPLFHPDEVKMLGLEKTRLSPTAEQGQSI